VGWEGEGEGLRRRCSAQKFDDLVEDMLYAC
jgi:hypothetical protein